MRNAVAVVLSLAIIFAALSGCRKDLAVWEQVQQLESFTTARLNDILFVDERNGFVVGGTRFYSAEILVTRDGGHSWTHHSFPEAGKGLYGITASPDGTLYTAGFDGKILISEDTGRSWQLGQLDWQPVKRLAFAGAGRGMAVGGISFYAGFMIHIDGDGQRQAYDSVGYELNDIKMTDPQTGYLCGYGVVQKTEDGGRSWKWLEPAADNFTALTCLDEARVWVCGYEGSIYKTEDGGRSWQRQRNGGSLLHKKYRLHDILFVDERRGYAVGEKGVVLYSDNGGANWMEYTHFTESTLRSIAVLPGGGLLVAGDDGVLYRIR